MSYISIAPNGVLSPCKDCRDRRVNCHAECPMYKRFEKENEQARKNKAKANFKHSCWFRG